MSDAERWRGHVDYIDHRVIRGWASDQNHPDQSVLIEAIAASGRRATAFANLFRPDLQAAGIGSGHHGYLIEINQFTKEDGPIVVRFASSKHALTEAPVYPDTQEALMRATMPAAFSQAMQLLAYEIDHDHDEMRDGLKGIIGALQSPTSIVDLSMPSSIVKHGHSTSGDDGTTMRDAAPKPTSKSLIHRVKQALRQ